MATLAVDKKLQTRPKDYLRIGKPGNPGNPAFAASPGHFARSAVTSSNYTGAGKRTKEARAARGLRKGEEIAAVLQ
jgi:hypothetical protein